MDSVRDQAVLETLHTYGELAVIDLADTLDSHPVAVDLCCYDLEDAGYVRQATSGVYTLTADGERHLSERSAKC